MGTGAADALGTPALGLAAPAAMPAADGAFERADTVERRLAEAVTSGDRGRIADACREFESLFVYRLLREMWKTIPKGGAMPEGFSQGAYRDMYQVELARYVAQHGGIGLADMLFAQLGRPAAPAAPDVPAARQEKGGADVEVEPSTNRGRG
jgi:flagellar protein FlgJ